VNVWRFFSTDPLLSQRYNVWRFFSTDPLLSHRYNVWRFFSTDPLLSYTVNTEWRIFSALFDVTCRSTVASCYCSSSHSHWKPQQFESTPCFSGYILPTIIPMTPAHHSIGPSISPPSRLVPSLRLHQRQRSFEEEEECQENIHDKNRARSTLPDPPATRHCSIVTR